MSLTRQWSQDDCLSRVVLAHTSRQATVWLTFDVRQKQTMKYKYSCILLAISSYCFAESIEIRDAGIAKFENGKATFVALEKIPNSELYVGCRLDARKSETGSISIELTNVSLEGFLELETGKLSPITNSEQKKFSIEKKSEEWTEIETPKGLKLSVRWKE